MRFWTNSARAHPHHVLPLLTQQIRVGKIKIQASFGEEYVQNVLLNWRRTRRLMSMLAFLWLVLPTLRPHWVRSTARYAETTFVYSPMAVHMSYHNFKGSGISRGINASDLGLLGGVSLVLTASFWPKMSWRSSATKFCELPQLFGQREEPVPRRLDPGCFRKHWSSTSCASQSFIPRRCAPTRWELRFGWASVGVICLDSRPGKIQRCLVAQWSFG